MTNTILELFITLIAAIITTQVTYYMFFLGRAVQMAEKRLKKFYYPALKRLKKCFGKDPDTPEVNKELKKILDSAIKNECLLDNETKCAICKMHAAYENRYVAKSSWNLCYQCNTMIVVDKKTYFNELYKVIKMNCYYLGDFINWPLETIKPNKPEDKAWIKKRRRKKEKVRLKLFASISLLFIIIYILVKILLS